MTLGLHLNRNGLFNKCEDGFVQLSDCPSFDCRPIAYVDKHATGTGDGTSRENAYTDIQTAVNNDSCKEILVQGYGEFDTYSAGILMPRCAFIKGLDGVWIDGENTADIGISGGRCDWINIKNCVRIGFYGSVCYHCWVKDSGNTNLQSGTFYACSYLDNCFSENSPKWGFMECDNINNCTATNTRFGFSWYYYDNTVATNCTAYDCENGFWNTSASASWNALVNCTSRNNTGSGFHMRNATLTGCIGHDNGGAGFLDLLVLTCINCVAYNNQSCGFAYVQYITGTYINCSEYNNCLSEGGDCEPLNCVPGI